MIARAAVATIAAAATALASPPGHAEPGPGEVRPPTTASEDARDGARAIDARPGADGAELAKKDRAARAKSLRHPAPPTPGRRPARVINLHNLWTKEWLAVDPSAPPAPRTLDRFLRDHFTNEATAMQPKLLPTMLAAAAKFRVEVIEVVSGFRHPKYNLILRKKGHQVARDSQHTHGTAIDFSLPTISVTALHAWAKGQRLGGVGFYADSGFVHMDTGAIRYWSGE